MVASPPILQGTTSTSGHPTLAPVLGNAAFNRCSGHQLREALCRALTVKTLPMPRLARLALFALPIVLFLVLALIVITAWWKGGPNLSTAYTAVGASLVALVINLQAEEEKFFNVLWYGLVGFAIAACIATAVSMVIHPSTTGSGYESAGAAFVAALAGLFVTTTKLTLTLTPPAADTKTQQLE
jgi:hypothetical protein